MKPYYEHNGIVIYRGDCREILPSLRASIVVTSPPYWNVRAYGEQLNWPEYQDYQTVLYHASRLRERQRVEAKASAERLEKRIQGDIERAKAVHEREEVCQPN